METDRPELSVRWTGTTSSSRRPWTTTRTCTSPYGVWTSEPVKLAGGAGWPLGAERARVAGDDDRVVGDGGGETTWTPWATEPPDGGSPIRQAATMAAQLTSATPAPVAGLTS
jgi:hypothetical protein